MTLQDKFESQGNWFFKRRSFLPLGILTIGIAMDINTELHPQLFAIKGSSYESYYETICLLISLLGLYIRIYTVGYTPPNTSGRNTFKGQIADILNTTGMYSIVRHPLYVGNFLMWLGIAMITYNVWFIVIFCLSYWIYYERIMYAEEQFLKRKFKESYLKFAENVPTFTPRFHSFIKSDLPFNWKKVLLKEKNGFFALFLIFTIFDIVGELINKTENYNYILIFMSLISGVGYVILKIHKHSKLLNKG
ncbi:MAG: methyltransferase family protein [Mangrovibacterium sp.]